VTDKKQTGKLPLRNSNLFESTETKQKRLRSLHCVSISFIFSDDHERSVNASFHCQPSKSVVWEETKQQDKGK
jgi:hypothetical protein